MKRLHSSVVKLDNLNLNIATLNDEIKDTEENIYRGELEKPNRHYTHFINTKLQGIRPDPRERPVGEPVNRMSIVLAKKSIASRIVGILGPQEQYILTRVARVFEPIVSDVVIEFSTLYLDQYKNETDKASCLAKLVVSYGAMDVKKRPPIHIILSLWDHFMAIEHVCHIPGRISASWCYGNNTYPIGKAFAYDPIGSNFIPLSRLDLFVIDQRSMEIATSAFTERWRLAYGFDPINSGLPLFNYNELCMLDIKRVADRVPLNHVYVVTKNGFHPLFATYAIYIVTPVMPTMLPSDDLYAQRINCVSRGARKFRYKECLETHMNRVKKALNIYC